MAPDSGPKLMGVDVIMVATSLAAIATFAVLVAIYAATTVRDPMAKRVKALNQRREQLKAGIIASTAKRRKKITNRNEAADKVRTVLSSLKMLQHDQVEKAQQKLMQAGIRSKDLAFVVIFVMNPTYMAGFFSEPRLMVAGLGGMVWMGIGVFIMAKMVNFEI